MALLIVILACGEASDTAGADSAGEHSIRIDEPADGATVCAAGFPFRLTVTGVTLVDAYDPPDPLPEDAAHVDIKCNGVDCLMAGTTEGEITGLESGFEYQIKAELSGADHEPLNPYAGDVVYVMVESSACS